MGNYVLDKLQLNRRRKKLFFFCEAFYIEMKVIVWRNMLCGCYAMAYGYVQFSSVYIFLRSSYKQSQTQGPW